MVPEYYVWKLWCGGVKIKTLHRNSPVQSGAGFKAIVCVRVCVHAHAGWWSTASCQHHRDTALIGTRGASVHHRQACWLNSLALKGPSHQNFHLLLIIFFFFFFFSSGGKSGSDPGFQHEAVLFSRNLFLNAHAHKCLWSLPFTHTSLMMSEGMLSKPRLFSHSGRWRKRTQGKGNMERGKLNRTVRGAERFLPSADQKSKTRTGQVEELMISWFLTHQSLTWRIKRNWSICIHFWDDCQCLLTTCMAELRGGCGSISNWQGVCPKLLIWDSTAWVGRNKNTEIKRDVRGFPLTQTILW